MGTQTSGGVDIDTNIAITGLVIAPGTLNDAVIVFDTLQSSTTVNATLSFRTENAIPAYGRVYITFPDGFDASDAKVESTQLNIGTATSISKTGNHFFTPGSHDSEIAAGTDVTLTLINIILPSWSGNQEGTFTVETRKGSGDTVLDRSTPISGPIIEKIITLTDAIAVSDPYTSHSGGTVTYTWQSDVTLPIGTTVEIAMPGFSGTAATSSTCQSTALNFTIANTGTGADYKVILTTGGEIVTANTDCAIAITGLTFPASIDTPAYKVTVVDTATPSQYAT